MPEHGQHRRPNANKSLVEFIVGNVHYAIDIAFIREIVNPQPVTPLPHSPAEIVGVTDHRGEVVPIIDLRVRFGLEAVDPTRTTKWILLNSNRGLIGLIVDGVTEVFGTAGEELRATPDIGGNKDVRGIAGVVTRNGTLTFVLDKGRLVDVVDALGLPEAT
jgi:purine-binding chemotaxis protein CheW